MAIPGMPLPVLLGLLFLVSLCAPPFESARSALMADVLEGERYVVATSLTNVSAAARPGGRLPRRRRAGRRARSVRGAADRRRDVRRLRASGCPPGCNADRRRWWRPGERPRSLLAGRRGRTALHRHQPAAARDRRPAVAGHVLRLRLGGRRHAARRRTRPERDGARRPAGRQPARRDHRRPGPRPPRARPHRRERLMGPWSCSRCCRCWSAGWWPRPSAAGHGAVRRPRRAAVPLGPRRLVGDPAERRRSCRRCRAPTAAAPSASRSAVSTASRASARWRPALAAEGVSPSGVVALCGGLGLLAVIPPLLAYWRTQGHMAAQPAAEGPSDA